jgi:hypothetical protein
MRLGSTQSVLAAVARAAERLSGHPAAPRWALLSSLALIWVNFLSTGRWGHVPGALHGPKRPLFLGVLLVATLVAARRWRGLPFGRVPWMTAAGGVLVLVGSFFVWFPLSTWRQIPFLDNWPARYQSTMDALALYRQGVAAGWEWHFLGGYHTSSDVTVTLSALAWLPVTLFGPPVGFHLLHLVLLVSLPVLIWLDLRLDARDADVGLLAAGLVALAVTGWFSYYLVRSGDTNSLAGTVCAVSALVGSHAAARGRRWGGGLLVAAMALVNYSHAGFFLYAALLLVVESAVYRDRRRLVRALIATGVGAIAALPLTWESWRYPGYFTFNNVVPEMPPFAWEPFLRKVYYNVELLALPWRWFNDFTGLSHVILPAVLLVALGAARVRDDVRRSVFHASAALAALALMRLNTPEFGYAFLRPVHLLAVFPPAAFAGFLALWVRDRLVVASTVALSAVYLQYLWIAVPHVPTPRAADPALVDYLRSLDGALILLENTFHRDMDADPTRETEPTPFAAHLEGLLVAATGRRFYAGLWDGWQWSPFRRQLLSGGAFQGRAIGDVSPEVFAQTLRRWGIRHILVWSAASRAYLAAHADFTERWRHDRWVAYELADADTRAVVVAHGSGTLEQLGPLGAVVRLEGVRRGEPVTVRTNYYPAWRATAGGHRLDVFSNDGQLAVAAPCDGRCDVVLEYPRRTWLTVVALLALLAGAMVLTRSAAREGAA